MKNAKIDEPTGLDPYESETVTSDAPNWAYGLITVLLFILAPLRWFK